MKLKWQQVFEELANLFQSKNYKFYLVGGAVRDFLLNKEPTDLDFVTDALPEQATKLLHTINIDCHFNRFGYIHFNYKEQSIDLNTMCVSSNYDRSGCPKKIIFTNNIEDDLLRHDFTINSLYMDKQNKIYDLCNGRVDLKNKLIRSIKNPYIAIQENPILILRALRYKLKYNFTIEPELENACLKYSYLLNNSGRVRANKELEKINKLNNPLAKELLLKYRIKNKY